MKRSGDFRIAVEPGVEPTFEWPGGNAKCLVVAHTDSMHEPAAWVLVSRDGSGFASPVSYGRAPADTQRTMPAASLVKGRRYAVGVQRCEGRIGSQEFAP